MTIGQTRMNETRKLRSPVEEEDRADKMLRRPPEKSARESEIGPNTRTERKRCQVEMSETRVSAWLMGSSRSRDFADRPDTTR